MHVLEGHEKILSFLALTAQNDRPAHAYLFSGREGVGKKLVALRFACFLNCPSSTDTDYSCSTCTRMVEGKHPDIRMTVPEKNMIRIDKVREIQSLLRYAPVECRYRVVIIDDAHLMNRSAQNALLKTLEEPPNYSILILVSSRPSLMLPTVRSRCRKVRFGSLCTESVVRILRNNGIAPTEAGVLARLASGSAGRALKMESAQYMKLREKVITVLSRSDSVGLRGALEFSATISSDRATAIQAIEIASTWIRDLLIEQIGSHSSEMIHVDFLDKISDTAHRQDSSQLISLYDQLTRAAELIEAEINVNPNLVTDTMMLKTLRILEGPHFGVVPANG